MKQRFARWASVASLSILATSAAWGAPISSNLIISASVSLDTANSADASGGALQGGTFTGVSGGVTSTASFSGLTFGTGSSPLTAALTDLDDGIGARLSMSGSVTVGQATGGLLGVDYAVSLQNTSLTETFVVTFRAVLDNAVSASGTDAYAKSMISVHNDIVFSDHRIDTLNTGSANNSTQASAGNTFAFTLAPGGTASFTAKQDQEGGVFAPGAFSADLSAFLKIDSVTRTGGPTNNVPLPGTLPLVALGMAALGAMRRRQSGA